MNSSAKSFGLLKPGPLSQSPKDPTAPWAGSQVLLFFGLYLVLQFVAGALALNSAELPDPTIDLEQTSELTGGSALTETEATPAESEQEVTEEPSNKGPSAPLLTRDQARPLFMASMILNGLLILLILFYVSLWQRRNPTASSFLLGTNSTVSSCLKSGLFACLAWLPIHLFLALIWSAVLTAFGHELNPQIAISLFGEAVEEGDYSLITFLVINIILIAPWLEELLFRGLLFRWLLGYRSVIASAVLSGVIFGVVHDSLASIFPIAALGVALALLYNRTGSLLTVILFHTFFNSIMISSLFLIQSAGIAE
ncbi:MAG: hypothetical protein CBC13_11130 [Planctomycetia bacterium TMED53]|nr:MAG: hypothetical protein CBC13_11130 [Planctomycetia bacterium TMED53]